MIRRTAAVTVALVTIVVITASAIPKTTGRATTPAMMSLAAGSELWMEGKSTTHDWECRTQTLRVTFTRTAGHANPAGTDAIAALVRNQGVQGVDVQIPVSTLHSKKKGVDKNMLKALKANQYPTIRFRMARYTVVSPAAADTMKLRLEGALTISGTEKPVTLDARAWKGDQGEWIAGTESLDMSDYGIKPPVMMMGAIKVKDRVTIHYRLLLVSGTAIAAAR